MKATLILAAHLAVAGAIFTGARAIACDSLSDVSDAACAQWAPIIGDVTADACPTAALDVDRTQAELAELDRPREPGAPLWSAVFLRKKLREALMRQAQVCAAHAADLP